jgi:hypothetical protein
MFLSRATHTAMSGTEIIRLQGFLRPPTCPYGSRESGRVQVARNACHHKAIGSDNAFSNLCVRSCGGQGC